MEITIQIRDELAGNLKTRAEFLGKTLEHLIAECVEELAEVDTVELAIPRLKQLLETDTPTTRRTLREQLYRY
jgi:hypothetical protein